MPCPVTRLSAFWQRAIAVRVSGLPDKTPVRQHRPLETAVRGDCLRPAEPGEYLRTFKPGFDRQNDLLCLQCREAHALRGEVRRCEPHRLA
jgi:hypothetical protein